MDEVESLDGYSALVLGSAVYLGAWMPAAGAFLERNSEVIASRSTWLFSSGPIAGVPAKPFDASALVAATHARDHHLFGGKLDRRSLTLFERAISLFGRPQEGDYREWAIAAAWATAISRSLAA
jgi:menaquinone-dependent protoporphyrinogen oxidase